MTYVGALLPNVAIVLLSSDTCMGAPRAARTVVAVSASIVLGVGLCVCVCVDPLLNANWQKVNLKHTNSLTTIKKFPDIGSPDQVP